MVMVNTDRLYDDETDDGDRADVDDDKTSNGTVNEVEADLTAKIMDKMLALGVAADDIGIMAPYRAQLRLIRSKLLDIDKPTNSILVDTIDRSDALHSIPFHSIRSLSHCHFVAFSGFKGLTVIWWCCHSVTVHRTAKWVKSCEIGGGSMWR